ncbi:MAG: 16S rRNA (guanine(966)-N(2))-methyltransferase RsmD [Oceanobacter sp.]
MSKVPSQQLRIIGGQWRSRRLRFQPHDGLRPTLDRVRETLFNWLQHHIEGARVLDAFAGSGALGMESLSRGAKEVIFLEKNPKVALQLRDNLKTLEARNAQVWAGDALLWLKDNQQTFDIILLDPPFNKDLLQPAIDALTTETDTLVYIEHEASLEPTFPDNWHEIKSKKTKEFLFRLFVVE